MQVLLLPDAKSPATLRYIPPCDGGLEGVAHLGHFILLIALSSCLPPCLPSCLRCRTTSIVRPAHPAHPAHPTHPSWRACFLLSGCSGSDSNLLLRHVTCQNGAFAFIARPVYHCMARLMPVSPAGSLQLQIKLVFIIMTIYFEPPHRNGWLRAIVPRIGNLCKELVSENALESGTTQHRQTGPWLYRRLLSHTTISVWLWIQTLGAHVSSALIDRRRM